jgi:NitT/TauT family transport system ATP-binding protein
VEMIVLKDVSFAYEKKNYILKDFSIEFPSNKISVLLGPNGVGKTTLLKLVAGILRPLKGDIKILGRDPSSMRGKIGYVPQILSLYPWMRVRENIELPLKIGRKNISERDKKIEEISRRLGIKDLLNKYPKEVSGGEAQKIMLARVFVSDVEILLLDEPLSMIDIDSREEIINFIREFSHEKKLTVLTVTHNIEDALSLGDFIYILNHRPLKLIDILEKDLYDKKDLAIKIRSLLKNY